MPPVALHEPAPRGTATAHRAIAVGIDLGTSGCRAVAIDEGGAALGWAHAPLAAPQIEGVCATQDPNRWWEALLAALRALAANVDLSRVARLAVDGTSGTVLPVDHAGRPLGAGLLYCDQRAAAQAQRIASFADPESGAHGAASSLAKLLWLQQESGARQARYVLHQADWIAGRLTGRYGFSDYNNCLKLGFDAVALRWPPWLDALGVRTELLPEVLAPGEPIGPIAPGAAQATGLPPDAVVVAGTTDGVAAFLAAGAHQPGEAVTSLGSTLVLKLLSTRPVFARAFGIYSHRFGRYWLAGGASNSGGAALLRHFSLPEIRALSAQIDPQRLTGLDYYPLPGVGERFPVSDPAMVSRTTPVPAQRVRFLQGLLEGIARIEQLGYERLAQHGAPALAALFTTGGGAQNEAWTQLRARILEVPLYRARSEQAAYGSALLAAGLLRDMFGLPA